MKMEKYDLIVIGAGAAGMTAALYAERYKLKILVIGKEIGGYLIYASEIENYPGFNKINGVELIKKIKEQIKSKIIETEVTSIENKKSVFVINKKFECKAIILATGTERRKLGIGEDKFIGKGVAFCATCDAPLFQGKTVAVIGGGNAAVQTALLLTKYAKKTYIICRSKHLKADPVLVDKLKGKVQIMCCVEVKKVQGDNFLQSILLSNNKRIKIDGLFIEIGNIPSTKLSKKLGLKLDKDGYVIVNDLRETNVKGVFAAGDIVSRTLKQIVTSAADGAIAAHSAFEFLEKLK